MAASLSTVVLKHKVASKKEKKQAPIKLSLPESWMDAPCLKLLDTWGKKKKWGSAAVCLLAGDGTPIPEEWPIEAALMLYGEEGDDEAQHATLYVAARAASEDDALRGAAAAAEAEAAFEAAEAREREAAAEAHGDAAAARVADGARDRLASRAGAAYD